MSHDYKRLANDATEPRNEDSPDGKRRTKVAMLARSLRSSTTCWRHWWKLCCLHNEQNENRPYGRC